MAKSAFIDDGYDIEAWIDETEDSPRIEFTYRRPLESAVRVHIRNIRHLESRGLGEEAEKITLTFMAKYLKKWNLDGDPIPDQLRKLKSQPFGRLFAILLGEKPDGVANGEMASEGQMAKN